MQITRRAVLAGFASLVSGPAFADPVDNIVGQLRGYGYTISEVRRTLLGRVRIVAKRNGRQREIVVDPRNGAILRDFTRDPNEARIFNPGPDNDRDRGSSGGAREDREDRDRGNSGGAREDREDRGGGRGSDDDGDDDGDDDNDDDNDDD